MLEAARSLSCDTSLYWEYFKASNGHRSPRQRARPLADGWCWALQPRCVFSPRARSRTQSRGEKERNESRTGKPVPQSSLMVHQRLQPWAGSSPGGKRVGRGDVSSLGGSKGSGQPRASSLEPDSRNIRTHR